VIESNSGLQFSRMEIIILISSIFFGPLATGGAQSDYRLGAGDVIKISGYEEPDLGLEITLSNAGSVSYLFLGELKVARLAVEQIEKLIADGSRGDCLIAPDVAVSMVQYCSFYIHGEVKELGG
jgi:polysaccharide biosynthesis/export protein VpsN